MERAAAAGWKASRREEPQPRHPAAQPTTPPRIAMLASVFPPSIGGIQSHTLRLGQELASRGVEVHVLTRVQPGLSPFERMAGVRVHRVGLASARGALGSAAFIAGALRAAMRLASAGHAQLLHAHQLLSPTTVGLLASPVTGLPLIVNPHACGSLGDVGVLSATPLGRLRLRAVVAHADAFVAVSRRIREELLHAGAPAHAVWEITNGVDTDRFSPATPSEKRVLRLVLGLEGGPLVVFSGRLAPEKGVDVLLRAWPRVVDLVPGARLCVVGSGGDEAQLRDLARQLGVEGSATWAGGVLDAAPYTRAADLAVLPSRTEGMPVALLEAMSAGVPVVATSVGGSAEVLEHGRTGLLVPPDDPAALGAAIAEALRDDAASSRRADAARAHALARHAMPVVADRYVALYQALLHRGGAHRALSLAPGGPSR